MKEKRDIYRFLHVTPRRIYEQAALRQKLGARALRAILEKVLHPVLFVGPGGAGERVVIEPEDVRRAIA
jgi:ATP-dependent protease Clp ATPase subunit